MTKFSLLSQDWQLKLVGSVAIVGTLFITAEESLAQIVPDNTLGAERSVVTPNVNIWGIQSDRIDGGAIRGTNLFHSFQDFNVGEGRGAYFANPFRIENILTRVTGSNASNILGRLGVLGGANLFLLNPNGIVFGANASLDIQGSFLATTADRIQLGDSGYFSAAEPQTSRLLSVSPGALFFDAVVNQPGSIINRGNLSTGNHLTLAAGNLDLQGQLQAGGDLTLQAQDTVKVRDTITSPFIATSGRNLTIQGNQNVDILALNHPLSKIGSGGNLNLVSDGDISGDAHFESGGSLSMLTLSGTPANFVSWFDPIIQANGDVLFGNYTGVALKVEATGSIQGGNIRITGAECAAGSPGCLGGIPTTDPDFATLTGRPSVILRAGLASVNTPNVPQNAGGTGFTATSGLPLGITVGNIGTSDSNGGNGGDIILNAAKGSISTGNLSSSSFSYSGNTGQGGAIALTAANDIYITGNLDSSSYSPSGNAGQGGAIALTAANGSISTGDLYSSSGSFFGNAGQGGAIGLTAANGSISTGDLYSYSGSYYFGNAGQGGAIALTATNDIYITGNLDSSSYSDGNVGQGGAIALTAANDIYITGDLYSSSRSYFGNVGQGGAIALTAANDIYITGDLYSGSSSGEGNAGNGGAIALTAANDIYITGNLSSSSYSDRNAGNGGAIALTAANDIHITGDLYSGSSSGEGNAGNGGAIGLTVANDIYITGNLYSYSSSGEGNAGNGGAISLIASSGDIVGISFEVSRYDNVKQKYVTEDRSPVLGSFSISERATAGNGGNVALEAKNNVSNLEILTLSSDSKSGAVQVTGLGNLLLTNTNILTSKQVTIRNPARPSEFITLNVGGEGQSGNVDVTSLGNLTFNNSSIQSDTKGSDRAGDVTVSSPGRVTFNNSFIRSNTSSAGGAGSININAGQGIALVGMEDSSPVLSVETSSAGQPGSITINTPSLTLSNTARITATATNTATNPQGGSITLNASTMDLAGVVGVFAETQGQTPAGTLTLKPYENQSTLNLTLAPQSLVSASTSGSGKGGNLIVQAPEAITIRGEGQLAVQTTGDGAAGDLRIETQRLTIADGATISASTSSTNPDGIGGNLTINATESFNLTNQARLLAQSTGAAPAGNITIQTGKLTANNGTIATSSDQSSGGGITITASNIRLFGNSDITSRVNSGAGGGGNIDLEAASILAFGDSDILAFARDGRGGNITFNTPAFFGENYRPAPRNTDPLTLDGNNRVDVNATGTLASGTILLPDTTFIQNSLTELPENQINTDSILANSCIVRRNQPTQGRFTITGAGGLPQRPGEVQISSFPTVDVETLPSDSTSLNPSPNRPWQKGDPIVEPQGVYRLPNGRLVMSRECS